MRGLEPAGSARIHPQLPSAWRRGDIDRFFAHVTAQPHTHAATAVTPPPAARRSPSTEGDARAGLGSCNATNNVGTAGAAAGVFRRT